MKPGELARARKGQLSQNRHNTYPMKEDVKGKSFSPPLWEMRVW
jgi:hypothetical protein